MARVGDLLPQNERETADALEHAIAALDRYHQALSTGSSDAERLRDEYERARATALRFMSGGR